MAKAKAKSAPKSIFDGIEHVIQLHANITFACRECKQSGLTDDLDVRINHYIQKHGYRLLFVGTESCGDSGDIRHDSTAFLGK